MCVSRCVYPRSHSRSRSRSVWPPALTWHRGYFCLQPGFNSTLPAAGVESGSQTEPRAPSHPLGAPTQRPGLGSGAAPGVKEPRVRQQRPGKLSSAWTEGGLACSRAMFFIIVITFIAITFLLLIFHLFRKLCQDPVPPPAYRSPQGPMPAPPSRDPQSPVPPPLTLMPTLPSLPSGAIPVGLEPPPYSEVTAKPFLYPLPQGPCPECGHMPTAQPPLTTRT
ncbi:uncharacterized protein ACIQIH_018848 isoform 2-T2 [Cyanocitta cristata]